MNNRQVMDALNNCAEAIAQKDDPFARQMVSYFFEVLEAEAIRSQTTSTFNAGEHIILTAKNILEDRLARGVW